MKINNLSNISFKSVYVVESNTPEPESDMEKIMRSFRGEKTSAEQIYDLLSLGGENKQVALMYDGGMFIPEGGRPAFISTDDPALLLLDDEVDKPATRLNEFKKEALEESSGLNELTLDGLKAKLTPEEIAKASEDLLEINSKGSFEAEEFNLGLIVQQKMIRQVTERYRALYAEFAKQAIPLRAEAISGVKRAIMDTAKVLANFKK